MEMTQLGFFNYIQFTTDNILISFFRFSENPLTGYIMGISVLSFICVITGEASARIAIRFNGGRIANIIKKINRYESLSITALKAGNTIAFNACNKIANESFGKSFFLQVTFGAAFLWPLLFALGWMQFRFADIQIPIPVISSVTGYRAGYFTTFITSYILTRIIYLKFKGLLLPETVEYKDHL